MTTRMRIPVRCTYCSGVYDLAAVTVTARYVDCSMWNAPCCGMTVDDRGETGWLLRKDYVRISDAEAIDPRAEMLSAVLASLGGER